MIHIGKFLGREQRGRMMLIEASTMDATPWMGLSGSLLR
jgi:hypothetical protein